MNEMNDDHKARGGKPVDGGPAEETPAGKTRPVVSPAPLAPRKPGVKASGRRPAAGDDAKASEPAAPPLREESDFVRRLREQREAAERAARERAAKLAATSRSEAAPPRPGFPPPPPPRLTPGATPGAAGMSPPPPPPGLKTPASGGSAAAGAGAPPRSRPPFNFADPPAGPAAEPPSTLPPRQPVTPPPSATGEGAASFDSFESELMEGFTNDAGAHQAPLQEERGGGRRTGLLVLLALLVLLILVLLGLGALYYLRTMNTGTTTPAVATPPAADTPAAGEAPVVEPPQKPVKVTPKPKTPPPVKRKQIYDRILSGDGAEKGTRIVPSEEPPKQPPRQAPQGGGEETAPGALPLPLPPPPAGGANGQSDAPGTEPPRRNAANAAVDDDAGTVRVQPTGGAAEKALSMPMPPAAADDAAVDAVAEAPAAAGREEEETAHREADPAITASTDAAPVSDAGSGGALAVAADGRERMAPLPRPRPADIRRIAAGTGARSVRVARAEPEPTPLLPAAVAGDARPKAFAPAATAPRKPRTTNFSAAGTSAAAAPRSLLPASRAAGQAAAPAAPQPGRLAALPANNANPPANAARGGGYVVQLASYRSRDAALAAWRRIRARHGRALGNLAPLIVRKELGDLGTFYRLAVGTLASRKAAQQLCTRLIARGVRDCLVRAR